MRKPDGNADASTCHNGPQKAIEKECDAVPKARIKAQDCHFLKRLVCMGVSGVRFVLDAEIGSWVNDLRRQLAP
jgi:hypothetical protein